MLFEFAAMTPPPTRFALGSRLDCALGLRRFRQRAACQEWFEGGVLGAFRIVESGGFTRRSP